MWFTFNPLSKLLQNVNLDLTHREKCSAGINQNSWCGIILRNSRWKNSFCQIDRKSP